MRLKIGIFHSGHTSGNLILDIQKCIEKQQEAEESSDNGGTKFLLNQQKF
jgi:hypothetical protein